MNWFKRFINWVLGRDEEPEEPPVVRPIPPTPVPIDPHQPPEDEPAPTPPPAPGPDAGPTPVPPAPAAPGSVSVTRSRFYIVADRPVNSPGNTEATAGEYGFKVGESFTFVVEVVDDVGKPMPSVSVRGIIDPSTSQQLPTVPKTGTTGPDGSFRARYTMRESDVQPGAAKLVYPVLIVGNSTVKLRPYPLYDTVNTLDNLGDPFFRGE